MVKLVPFDWLSRSFLFALFTFFTFFVFFSLGVNADSAQHDTGCDANDSSACAPVGQWELSLGIGLGLRTNPLVEGSNTPIILLPSLSYYGERFFFDTSTAGFTLIDQPKHLLNIIATISLDQTFFDDGGIGGFFIDPVGGGGEGFGGAGDLGSSPGVVDSPVGTPIFTPLPVATPTPTVTPTPAGEFNAVDGVVDLDDLHERRMGGFLGFEYSYIWSDNSLNFQALSEVSGLYSGEQVRISYEHLWMIGRQGVKTTVGAEWRSAQMNDYYFGIRLSEVTIAEQSYQVGADLSPFLKINWQAKLTKRWSAQAAFHRRWLGTEIANSPLVDESMVSTVFVGGVYHF